MSQKIILIVEDEKDIRKNLKKILEMEGYLVEQAENGKEALAILHSSTSLPAMIILDLMMPVMDGFEFRDQQEKIPKIATIPIAIMTADDHIDEKKMRIRAAAAMKKPASIQTILDTVKRIAG